MTRAIDVSLGERSYSVRVGAGCLGEIGELVRGVGDVSSVVVVTDSTVAGLYADRVMAALGSAGLATALLTFPAGERNKTLATVSTLFDQLFAVRPRIDRATLVVTLGGGVPGDMGGFLAATALRGLRFVQCPTTLLADVDASVGGKTGVDHPAGKNLIGAFHQPRGVLIDVKTIETLPPREVRGGLAECVKHAVIRDASLLEFIEDNVEPIAQCDAETLVELVARNVAIKAAVVSADEREAGQRAHLNFGHTIGHAIEAFVGYGRITHGEAVSLGMVAANRLAVGRGLLEAEPAQRVEQLLVRLGLPVRWDGLDAAEIWRIMQHDKKARGGRIHMVLPVMLAEVAVFDDVTPEAIRNVTASLS